MTVEASGAEDDTPEEADERANRTSGRRVILALYVVVVAIAGFTGFMLGYIGPRGLHPVTILGVVTFQPTPVGLAAYGALTLATVLGVLLVLVKVVSERYPNA